MSDATESEASDADEPDPDGSTHSDADDAASVETPTASVPDDDRTDGPPVSRRRLVTLSVGLLAGIGGAAALAWTLFGRDSDTTDPATTRPAGPAPNASTIADDFERSDSAASLGTAPTGQGWTTVSGTWGISDGKAYVPAGNSEGGGRSITLVELGSGDGSVTATASTITNGWGLVFRYLGPLSYWMLQASTDFSTYNLSKVVGGEVVAVSQGGIGLSAVEDGVRVGVEFHGRTIGVVLDDVVVKVFEDSDLQNGTQVGMIVSGPAASTARWDDFAAGADPARSAEVDTDD
jgi:hypothetical protein